jgi:hypothetical protein
VKYKSALLTAASGSIRGITASRNRGGSYFRGRTVPVNPNTIRQQSVREILGSLANAWTNQLTQVQRDGWNAYATAITVVNSLGDQVKLSGVNQFIRSNSPRQQAGLARIDVAPVNLTIGDTPIVGTASFDPGSGDIEMDASILTPALVTDAALLYVSAPVSAGRAFFAGPYKFVGKTQALVTGVLTITGLVPSLPGPASNLFYRLTVSRTDGRYSAAAQGMMTSL